MCAVLKSHSSCVFSEVDHANAAYRSAPATTIGSRRSSLAQSIFKSDATPVKAIHSSVSRRSAKEIRNIPNGANSDPKRQFFVGTAVPTCCPADFSCPMHLDSSNRECNRVTFSIVHSSTSSGRMNASKMMQTMAKPMNGYRSPIKAASTNPPMVRYARSRVAASALDEAATLSACRRASF